MRLCLQIAGCWWGLLAFAATLLPDAVVTGTRAPFFCAAGGGAWTCPFCGLTRSFVAMGNGDIAAARQAHGFGPLIFLAFAAAGGVALWTLWVDLRKRRFTVLAGGRIH